MAEKKSPGNDGLPIEFYKTFWKDVKNLVMDSYTDSLLVGQMAPSQRQSVIRLIRKKDKDPAELKNWRPISLMNVDTKILSTVLTERLKRALDRCISSEQLGFMAGKLMAEGNRLIDLLTDYVEAKNESGIVAGVDFAKAFDSISHEYIIKLLRGLIQVLSSTWRTYATTTAPLKPLAEEPVAAQEKCIGTHSENSKLQNEEEEAEKLMVGGKQRCKKRKNS
jgi:hypothetical protein